MRWYIWLLAIAVMVGCNNKKKELELKEQELALQAQLLQYKIDSTAKADSLAAKFVADSIAAAKELKRKKELEAKQDTIARDFDNEYYADKLIGTWKSFSEGIRYNRIIFYRNGRFCRLLHREEKCGTWSYIEGGDVELRFDKSSTGYWSFRNGTLKSGGGELFYK